MADSAQPETGTSGPARANVVAILLSVVYTRLACIPLLGFWKEPPT